MKLIENIKIYINNEKISQIDQDHTRVQLSNGISQVDSSNNSYAYNSFIPKLPWRSLINEEKDILLTNRITNTKAFNTISVIKVPSGIVSPITDILYSFPLEIAYKKIWKQGFLGVLCSFSERFLNKSKSYYGISLKKNPAGLITTTSDDKSDGLYIGLHIDSFFNAPLNKRHQSPNRICFNVGCEDRYLIFVNLELRVVADKLQNNIDREWNKDGPNLIKLFMKQNPNYPIVKLKIKPGEAYIAPTENIIHDSTTSEKSYEDFCITILGNFNTRK